MLLMFEVKRKKALTKDRLKRNEIKAGYLLHVSELSILEEGMIRTEEVAYEQAEGVRYTCFLGGGPSRQAQP
jgi:hypothetical protein